MLEGEAAEFEEVVTRLVAIEPVFVPLPLIPLEDIDPEVILEFEVNVLDADEDTILEAVSEPVFVSLPLCALVREVPTVMLELDGPPVVIVELGDLAELIIRPLEAADVKLELVTVPFERIDEDPVLEVAVATELEPPLEVTSIPLDVSDAELKPVVEFAAFFDDADDTMEPVIELDTLIVPETELDAPDIIPEPDKLTDIDGEQLDAPELVPEPATVVEVKVESSPLVVPEIELVFVMLDEMEKDGFTEPEAETLVEVDGKALDVAERPLDMAVTGGPLDAPETVPEAKRLVQFNLVLLDPDIPVRVVVVGDPLGDPEIVVDGLFEPVDEPLDAMDVVLTDIELPGMLPDKPLDMAV
ncbi:hypothetical protein F5Y16DRAFT_403288 [Xylariaceae sp. FL0255]|nr:hypothetical protein F5Y16DRAFT_403288 [Xylariaceae sp. FL0255]